MKEKIVVINFESEYAYFLAKSIRFLGYYSEVQNPNISLNDLENTKGIIFARKNDENFTSAISVINEQITTKITKATIENKICLALFLIAIPNVATPDK